MARGLAVVSSLKGGGFRKDLAGVLAKATGLALGRRASGAVLAGALAMAMGLALGRWGSGAALAGALAMMSILDIAGRLGFRVTGGITAGVSRLSVWGGAFTAGSCAVGAGSGGGGSTLVARRSGPVSGSVSGSGLSAGSGLSNNRSTIMGSRVSGSNVRQVPDTPYNINACSAAEPKTAQNHSLKNDSETGPPWR